MKCLSHPKYYARKKPNTACVTCWKVWEWSRFASWAIKEGISPDNVNSLDNALKIGVRNATGRLMTEIEVDLYNGKVILR
jgi:hypothetical protein